MGVCEHPELLDVVPVLAEECVGRDRMACLVPERPRLAWLCFKVELCRMPHTHVSGKEAQTPERAPCLTSLGYRPLGCGCRAQRDRERTIKIDGDHDHAAYHNTSGKEENGITIHIYGYGKLTSGEVAGMRRAAV